MQINIESHKRTLTIIYLVRKSSSHFQIAQLAFSRLLCNMNKIKILVCHLMRTNKHDMNNKLLFYLFGEQFSQEAYL